MSYNNHTPLNVIIILSGVVFFCGFFGASYLLHPLFDISMLGFITAHTSLLLRFSAAFLTAIFLAGFSAWFRPSIDALLAAMTTIILAGMMIFLNPYLGQYDYTTEIIYEGIFPTVNEDYRPAPWWAEWLNTWWVQSLVYLALAGLSARLWWQSSSNS